ncbi:MAG: DDE-type integrase/transposase/recombinase [Elusimicrobiota bacterium]
MLTLEEKRELLDRLNSSGNGLTNKLNELGLPKATYYRWRNRYEKYGIEGLKMKPKTPNNIWNKLSAAEQERVKVVIKAHPELSARLIAVKITDEEDFYVCESSVYRILKSEGLLQPRAVDIPAAQEWKVKTTKPDQIWQCDATNYFVVGWGYYKQITALDDYSRNVVAWDLYPDETCRSISWTIEKAVEEARKLGHLKDGKAPMLLSDNGSGFKASELEIMLSMHGIHHIFGKPYHPQTQGKIERFHRNIKGEVCLIVYCSPEELKAAVAKSIDRYVHTPHKAHKNVCPLDVYMGRKEEVLEKRRIKKQLTLERRKRYNSGKGNGSGSTDEVSK